MVVAMMVVFTVGIIIGFPLLLTLIAASLTPTTLNPDFVGNVQFVLRSIIGGGDSTSILAAPLFVLSGVIMARGGLAGKIYNVFAYFFGRFPGGMPCTVILTCLFYGAISGSGTATCAAVGSMCIPILLELGYDNNFTGALVAAAAGLGVIIPPSVPFIMYGTATGVSIGKLFIAGIVPGCFIAFCLIIYTIYYCITKGENRVLIESKIRKLHEIGFLNLLKDGIWALLTPVILLGGIYSGIVTPTEVACVSVIYALIVSLFVYKSIKPSEILSFFAETVKILAPLGLMIATATAFGRVMTLLQLPYLISDFVTSHFSSKVPLLLMLNLIMLLIGMVMDTGPALLIFGPMLLPVASAMGIDGVHLGIIMVVSMAIGFVTPPFGMTLFVASPICGATPLQVGKTAIPYILTFIVALFAITFIPALSLCLL